MPQARRHCLGLRAMQVTWNLRNESADGVKEERTGGGLTNVLSPQIA